MEIDSSADGKLEIDALLFFSEHLCSRNTINAGRPKQKTNPPSSTVFDGLPLFFSFSSNARPISVTCQRPGPIASSGRLFDRVRMDCVCA